MVPVIRLPELEFIARFTDEQSGGQREGASSARLSASAFLRLKGFCLRFPPLTVAAATDSCFNVGAFRKRENDLETEHWINTFKYTPERHEMRVSGCGCLQLQLGRPEVRNSWTITIPHLPRRAPSIGAFLYLRFLVTSS